MTHRITFDFTQEDISSWFRFSYKTSEWVARQRGQYIAKWTGIFFSLATVVSLYLDSWETTLASFAVAAVLSWSTKFRYAYHLERACQQNVAAYRPENYGPSEIILSAEGFREIEPGIETQISWRNVENAAAEGPYLFIVLNTGKAAVVCNRNYSGSIPFNQLPIVVNELRQNFTRISATQTPALPPTELPPRPAVG